MAGNTAPAPRPPGGVEAAGRWRQQARSRPQGFAPDARWCRAAPPPPRPSAGRWPPPWAKEASEGRGRSQTACWNGNGGCRLSTSGAELPIDEILAQSGAAEKFAESLTWEMEEAAATLTSTTRLTRRPSWRLGRRTPGNCLPPGYGRRTLRLQCAKPRAERGVPPGYVISNPSGDPSRRPADVLARRPLGDPHARPVAARRSPCRCFVLATAQPVWCRTRPPGTQPQSSPGGFGLTGSSSTLHRLLAARAAARPAEPRVTWHTRGLPGRAERQPPP